MNSRLRRLHKNETRSTPKERREWARLMRREVKAKDVAELTPAKIINWLNDERPTAAVKRVTKFIYLFNRARELNASFRLFFDTREDMFAFLSPNNPAAQWIGPKDEFSSGWRFTFPHLQSLNQELNQTLAALNKIASRYRWHPFIRHMGYGLMEFDVTETWKTRGTEEGREIFAIWWLCGQRGRWIDNFRQCRECGKWLFALVDHQSFCSDACRKRFASHDQDFREKRRAYMRKYRRTGKEKDQQVKTSLRRAR